jgi:cobalt-zinc-cadmium efflux system membrane fusion protein
VQTTKDNFMKFNKLIALAITIVLLACNGGKKEPNAASSNKLVVDTLISQVVTLSNEQLKNANLSYGFTQTKSMHKIVKVNGLIDVPPSNIVSISIPMGGYLKKTSLIPGMLVKKGNLLAVMEDPIYIELQQDYLTAKSKLVYLEADFNRQKDLNATKATSDKIFQLAKSDYESQKYLVKSLSEKLKLIGIDPLVLNESNISRAINFNSPINGYITKVNVNIGKYVTPTDVLFEIIDPSDLHLRLIVYENDATNLKVGNKVIFYTNNNLNQKYLATVAVITPNINEERTTEVHCHLVNESVRLYPGTSANAEIELNNAKVNAVPEDAIVKWENKPFVFIKVGAKRFKMIPVEIGVSNNGFIEIKTNLDNQELVLTNAYTLLMQLKNNPE